MSVLCNGSHSCHHDQLYSACISSRPVDSVTKQTHMINQLNYIGKVRLAKWFTTLPPKQKAKIVKDVTQLVLARRTRMCNFLEYKGKLWYHCIYTSRLTTSIDSKVVYRRYASLFFVCGIGSGDNELVTLEIIHRYVEVLDRYFGNVSVSMSYCHTIQLSFASYRFANLICECFREMHPSFNSQLILVLVFLTFRRHTQYAPLSLYVISWYDETW